MRRYELSVGCASTTFQEVEGSKVHVILSEAKDHLATLDSLKMILRYAQDDSSVHCAPNDGFILPLLMNNLRRRSPLPIHTLFIFEKTGVQWLRIIPFFRRG